MNVSLEENNAEFHQLVTASQLQLHLDILIYGIRPGVIFIGLFANTLNAFVFFKLGLFDPVNLSFFSLSLADLGFLILSAAAAISSIVAFEHFPSSPWIVHPMSLMGVFIWYSMIFYDTSMVITAFISLTRCCCVALPLKFKSIFTKKRTMVTVTAIFVTNILLRLPILITQRISPVRTLVTNTTIYMLRFTSGRTLALALNDIINRNILAWSSMAVMLVCLVILAKHLRASAKFRRSMQSSMATEKSSENTRELRVVQMVALVTLVFLVLALPFMCYSLTRRLIPGFGTSKYANLFQMISTLSAATAYLNSTLNAAVYFLVNSKYRAVAKSIFHWKIFCEICQGKQ